METWLKQLLEDEKLPFYNDKKTINDNQASKDDEQWSMASKVEEQLKLRFQGLETQMERQNLSLSQVAEDNKSIKYKVEELNTKKTMDENQVTTSSDDQWSIASKVEEQLEQRFQGIGKKKHFISNFHHYMVLTKG